MGAHAVARNAAGRMGGADENSAQRFPNLVEGTTARTLRLRPSSLNPPPRVDQLRQGIQILLH